MEGNNLDPSSPFPGSPTGTEVTLGPGDYVVSETYSNSIFDDIQTFFANHPDPPQGTGSFCTFIF